MRTMKKIVRWVVLIIALCVLGCAGAAVCVYYGILQLNNPSKTQYPVRGVDVSHYQGDIDWKRLEEQDVDFAYIKATEGSSHTDEKFARNWRQVKDTSVKAGAYHFFSFDSPGKDQADNFMNQVIAFEGMLPPAVDVEFYGDKKQNPPDKEAVAKELQIMLDELERYYQRKPVIYATRESWELYIKDQFSEYPLWIRNIITKPSDDIGDWVFWQYTNRGKLDGYAGSEKYIDINTFCGSQKEWEMWLHEE